LKREAAVLMTLAFILGNGGGPEAGGAPTPSRVSLKGSVMRGFFVRPGGASREPTYHVELDLTNAAAAPITFDVAEAAWLTGEGKGLHARTTQKGGASRLEGGESAEYEFDTDGYTGNLLKDAKGGPLFFQFALLLKGEVVASPFRALLPPLQSLPDYAAVKTAEREGGAVTVLYLRFVAGRRAPMGGPSARPIPRKARSDHANAHTGLSEPSSSARPRWRTTWRSPGGRVVITQPLVRTASGG
jgi:hypothetical protein